MTVRPLSPGDPDQIGPYRLMGRIGVGGMGSVYLGETTSGQQVALKVIRADLADDPGFRRRFAREVAAARLVRSHVTAAVLDADPLGHVPWVAFEYVDAPNLAQVVTSGVPRLSACLGIMAGIAEALVAIHEVGLVHRDLKPANVLVPPRGVAVIDFGIAAALDATLSSAAIGTPAWLAPEQIEGRAVTPATDTFAWGCLAAYTATGRHPFGGNDQSPAAVMYRIVRGEPDLAGVPPELYGIVARALDRDPAKRPTDTDLVRALLPGVAPDTPTAPVWNLTSPDTVAQTQPTMHQTTATQPHANRRRLLLITAIAVAVAIAALAALLVANRNGSHRTIAGVPPRTVPSAIPSTTANPPTTLATVGTSTPPAITTVSVTSCPTQYGVQGATSPPTPPSLAAPTSIASRLGGFSNGSISALGPTGWSCTGLVGANGGRSLTIYPPGEPAPELPGGTSSPIRAIFIEIPSAQTGNAPSLACPLFSTAAAMAPTTCAPPPAQESVHRSGSDVVEFEDPAGVTGDGTPSGGSYPANGVMIWNQSGQYSALATCTLPEAEHAVCTAVLNNFLAHYRNPGQ
jgi:serine/threonine protein kinase